MRRLLVLGVLFLGGAVPGYAQTSSETVEYFGQDAIGSIRIVFTPVGTVVTRQDYEPFGGRLFAGSDMSQQGFGAQDADHETGQAYFHARMYQLRAGRFSSPDPAPGGLTQPQGWNRYAYALNSPAAHTDRTGLCPDGAVYCFSTGVTVRGHVPELGHGGGDGGNNGEYDADQSDPQSTDGGSGGVIDLPGDPIVDPPETPPGSPDPPKPGPKPDPDPTVFKACGAGLGAYVDAVIPFGDPLKNNGWYDPSTPGLWAGRIGGEALRDVFLFEAAGAPILGRIATSLGTAGRNGSRVAQFISSGNRFIRLGLGKGMGRGARSPVLRVGVAKSELGRWLTHMDLVPDLKLSPPVQQRFRQLFSRCK